MSSKDVKTLTKLTWENEDIGAQPTSPLLRKFVRFRLSIQVLLNVTLVVFTCAATADTLHSQTVQLNKGWNAVHLQVNPTNSAPDVIFGSSPVDVVAVYRRSSVPAQFVSNPDVDFLRESGWNVWYAPTRPDSFLSDLFAINGPAALLIHSRANTELQLFGGVVPLTVQWTSNGFSFLGVGLLQGQEPTFAQYFSGSPAHQHNRFYRLESGRWKQILEPDNTPMRAGEAFWAYSEGPSKYQAPLDVEFPTADGVVLSGSTVNLIFRNRTTHPVTARLHHEPNGVLPAPVAVRVQVLDDPTEPMKWVSVPMETEVWQIQMPALEAGKSRSIPFEARLENMTRPLQGSLLRVSTDLGTETWIPLITIREDLIASP